MNNINPATTGVRTSNEVRLSPKQKSLKDIEKKTKAVGEESLSLASSISESVSLEDREVSEGSPDEEEDLSFLQDILSVTDDLASGLEEEKETLSFINESDEKNAEFIQENISELENAQEAKSQETSTFVNAFAKHETLKTSKTTLNQTMISLKESQGLLDVMMGNEKEMLKNRTVAVHKDDITIIKMAEDATPEELAKAKTEDFGAVVGDRHFQHPKSKLKPGDVVFLMVNGQQMQLRVEIMREDQAAKFEKLNKDYVDQRTGSMPVKEQKDNNKLVADNFNTERLKPKDLRHEHKKDKPEVNRTGKVSISKSEIDKQADRDAASAKAAKAKDDEAAEVREKAVKKELQKGDIRHEEGKKVSVEEDTVTVMQASVHQTPDIKPSAIRVKTSTKNTIRKAQE